MTTPDFPPSYAAALARLNDFAPKAGRDYASLRNFDLEGHPHVSRLSPYVRHRILPESVICETVLNRHSAQAAEKFLQEVCWRTYWKSWLDRRPQVWSDYLAQVSAAENRLATEAGLRANFEAACKGETGIDGFDHWAKELTQTGYLHNHARMWFASIWIFTLRLPWALGADHFLRHLLDGDPASNTLGWRWVAGIQTPGKTYAATTSNITKYTEGRFRPLHQLANADQITALNAPDKGQLRDCPSSDEIPAGTRTGLLLTEDDLSPGYMLKRFTPTNTAILIAPNARSTRNISPHVSAFSRAIAHDTAERWQDRLGKIEIFETAAQITDWASRNDLENIATPHLTTGPASSIIRQARRDMQAQILPQLRAWDTAALPYATAGFFKFKAKIPQLLATIGQD